MSSAKGLGKLDVKTLQFYRLANLIKGGEGIENDSDLYAAEFNKIKLLQVSEVNFLKLFFGKKIAIVGPCDKSCFIDEVHCFDTVVVTNCLSNDVFHGFAGNKVSYYNQPFWVAFKDEILEFSKRNDVYICVNRGFYNDFAANRSVDALIHRTVGLSGFLVTNPGLLAIQRIIWDVIKFQPNFVKVFAVNFFQDEYRSDYMREEFLGYIARKNVGISHDPYFSFMLTKLLVKMGLIVVDEYSNKFLDISINEYNQFLINLNNAGGARA